MTAVCFRPQLDLLTFRSLTVSVLLTYSSALRLDVSEPENGQLSLECDVTVEKEDQKMSPVEQSLLLQAARCSNAG